MYRSLLFTVPLALALYAPLASAQAMYEPSQPAASPQQDSGMQAPNNAMPDIQPLPQDRGMQSSTPVTVSAPPAVAGVPAGDIPSSVPPQPVAPAPAPGQTLAPDTGMNVEEPEEGDMGEQPKNEPVPAPPAPPQQPVVPVKPGEGGDTEFSAVVLQGLNKVTAHAETIIAPLGSVVRFGTIEIVAHSCWKAAPEDRPENAALLEISEVKQGEAPQQIFLGWMFSSSPGLSSLEHPFYDITVVKCSKTGGEELNEEPKAAKEPKDTKDAKPSAKAAKKPPAKTP